MPYREDIPGFMPLTDLRVIEALSETVPANGIVVEVGSYFGRSSWAFAKSVDPSVKVYCIDPWIATEEYNARLEDFKEYTKDCSNIIAIKGCSPDIPWPAELKIDLAFIDGNHKSPYVDKDLDHWSKKLSKNGILSGHDFNPKKYPDVCRAVIRASQTLKRPFRIFDDSTIWFLEMGIEDFNWETKKRLSKILHLETMSWQPDETHIKMIQNVYE